MGLDVYLYSEAEQDASNAHSEGWEDYYAEWGEKPDSPEKEAARKAVPDYGSYTDVKSERHPDHICNRRYLRSSYNESGFNRAVPDMIGVEKDFYWIFLPVRSGDDYETQLTDKDIPALLEVKTRALEVAAEIRQCDPLRTTTAHSITGAAAHMWSRPPTQQEFLNWYRDEQERHKDKKPFMDQEDFSYSTAKGHVLGFKTGLEVLAATTGQGFLGPEAIMVYRAPEETKQHYAAAAEIAAELCDEAIVLIKNDGRCHLHWSA